jgi:hypothetical protein
MPGSCASVFGEAEDFQAALSANGVAAVLVTGRGQFRARMTQLALESMRLAAVEEASPRIAFMAVPAGMVVVAFPIDGGPSPVWGGHRDPSERADYLRARRAAARKNSRSLSLGRYTAAQSSAY